MMEVTSYENEYSKKQIHPNPSHYNRIIYQTRSRDFLICLAALAILATITLPSLLLNHPAKSSEEESTTATKKERTRSAEKVSYQDLLVKEPIYPVEGADPDFWLASSRQWLENQVGDHFQLLKDYRIISFMAVCRIS